MFICCDDLYNSDSREPGIAEVIVAKQRNGLTGVVKPRFTKEFTRIDNLEQDEYYDELGDFDASAEYPNSTTHDLEGIVERLAA